MSGITADAIAEALAAQQDVSASDPKAVIAFTLKYLREQEDGGADAEGSEADQRRYGFIGIGTINSAVIRGLLSASAVQLAPNTITVSPRNAQRAAALAEQFPQHVKVASTNQVRELLCTLSNIFGHNLGWDLFSASSFMSGLVGRVDS